ncbi:MAG: Rossmann-like and DUF2520 domain-containing protein [Wujia sp.]
MRIGFIGAGKMGFTMGKHLADYSRASGDALAHGIKVMGYYSRNPMNAKEAAEFTDTKYYNDMTELVRECDMLFFTTSDGSIEEVAGKAFAMLEPLEEKIFVHTSGALSSRIFSGMGSTVFGYSIHPLYAVSSKTESYINFSECYITIEGHERYIDYMEKLFRSMGHSVKLISADNKVKYHASAVFASNLVIGLYHMAGGLLEECGFTESEALEALMPLFRNNAENLCKKGCEAALTGPVARGDVLTVEKHLSSISGDVREVYKLLSKELVKLVQDKREVDCTSLKKILLTD